MALKNCVMLEFYNMEMASVGSTYYGVAEGKPLNVDLCISELDNEGICKNKIVVFVGENNFCSGFCYTNT